MPMPLPKTEDLSTFDPFSLPFRNDPLAFHPQLLAASPGFIMMEGVRSAYIARHDQVMAVLHRLEEFLQREAQKSPRHGARRFLQQQAGNELLRSAAARPPS